MHRFLIAPSDVRGSTILITDPRELRHLRAVLRLGPGDRIRCLDGAGVEYVGLIREVMPDGVLVSIEERTSEPASVKPPRWLAQSLLKSDRFDWALQKATELGATRITPLITARTVVAVSEEHRSRKCARWRRIAEEAAKQCGRACVPMIEAPQRMTRWRPEPPPGVALIATLASGGEPIHEVLGHERTLAQAQRGGALILIGPEGDFTPEEVRIAERLGIRPVSLGPLTLRAETAAVAALAILGYVLDGKASSTGPGSR